MATVCSPRTASVNPEPLRVCVASPRRPRHVVPSVTLARPHPRDAAGWAEAGSSPCSAGPQSPAGARDSRARPKEGTEAGQGTASAGPGLLGSWRRPSAPQARGRLAPRAARGPEPHRLGVTPARSVAGTHPAPRSNRPYSESGVNNPKNDATANPELPPRARVALWDTPGC